MAAPLCANNFRFYWDLDWPKHTFWTVLDAHMERFILIVSRLCSVDTLCEFVIWVWCSGACDDKQVTDSFFLFLEILIIKSNYWFFFLLKAHCHQRVKRYLWVHKVQNNTSIQYKRQYYHSYFRLFLFSHYALKYLQWIHLKYLTP